MVHSYEQADWFNIILKKYGGHGQFFQQIRKGYRRLYYSSIQVMLNQIVVYDLKGESFPLDFNLQHVTNIVEEHVHVEINSGKYIYNEHGV